MQNDNVAGNQAAAGGDNGETLISASLLQAVMDNADDAIFVKDTEGRFLLFNHAAAHILGLVPAQVLGKTAHEIFGQEVGGAIRAIELAVMNSGQSQTREEIIKTAHGPRIFLATRSPYRDKNGRITGLIGISRDITERRHAEQALHDSETRWQFAVDGSGDGIWDWDIRADRVFYSPQWKTMLGYSDGDVGDTAGDWTNLVHPDDVDRAWKTVEDHFKDHSSHFTIELRMRAKDGSWRWILDRGKVIERAPDGSPVRAIGTHTDITERKMVEHDLRTERERLQLAADVSQIGVWEYEMAADLLRIDETCHRIFGLDPASNPLPTMVAFKAIVHPDDVHLLTAERLAEITTRAKNRYIEFRILRPSGEIRWITSAAGLQAATPLAPRRFVGIVTDITERRQAEEERQRSYEALRLAEKMARIGNWTLDLASGALTSSDMLYEMNGLDPRTPITMDSLKNMLSPESYRKTAAAVERCIETGEPYGFDAVHYRPDGTSFAVYIRGEAQRDAQGRIFALSGTVQDVSEREEARLRLENLADNLPSGAIYRVEYAPDVEATISYASAGMQNLCGLSPDQFNHAAFLDAIYPTDRQHYLNAVRIGLQEADTYESQFRILRPDGELRWMRCRATPSTLRPDGSSVWDGLIFDITREREIADQLIQAKEAAEAGERAKADFMATMSHEIRTPMNTVIGMTRLVQQTDLSPRQRNYLEKIDVSAKALLGIINDVLDYSKIEAGMLALEDTEFELEEVLETVSAVTAMRAEEKGLEIAYRIAPRLPRRLRGDPLRLGQVLINLVGNAVKFTETGEIVVQVESIRESEEEAVLSFSVRDTGIGLDRNQIELLFRPFSQAESQTTRRYGGTGLGLAICRELVELMGGQIEVESTPAAGSTFHFTIRTRKVLAPRAAGVIRLPRSILTGARVLIIDDNASARDILSDMVEGFGMNAETAASGEEGLRILRERAAMGTPFEIVLTDWRMPGMDGLEVARRIREEEHFSRTPAVLMVTAYGREEVLQRVEQLKLQGLLIKPITESVMFNTLTEILEPQSLRENAAKSASSKSASSPDRKIDPRTTLVGRKILVVDDNALNREVATDFLELVGVRVTTAVNGREALAALETGPFDAVLMDVHMPVMDGLEATRLIRQQPAWKNLPVIALTAQARSEDQAIVTAAGMDGHLTKPIDESKLYDVVASLIVERGAADAGRAPPSAPDLRVRSSRHIDVSAMMTRFRGRTELVSHLLNGFHRDFAAVPQEIERLTAAGDTTDLMMLLHTLRGSVGYLGAAAIATEADHLERAAKSGDLPILQALAPAFVTKLRGLLREVEQAAKLVGPAESPARDVNTTAIPAIIEQLQLLVDEADYGAVTLFEQLKVHLEEATLRTLLAEARQSFDDLDRKAALATLRKLAAGVAASR